MEGVVKFMLVVAIVASSAIVASLGGCEDAGTARRVLDEAGYSEVRTTGYSWFGCSRGDVFSTGFVAIGPAGKRVEGVVCSSWGWAKGATIRHY